MHFLDYFAIFSNKNYMICKQKESQSYNFFKKSYKNSKKVIIILQFLATFFYLLGHCDRKK